jgi:hypothetical protein
MKTPVDKTNESREFRRRLRAIPNQPVATTHPAQAPEIEQLALYPPGSEAKLLAQSIRALRTLSKHGYETAREMGNALAELNELMAQPTPHNRWKRRKLCAQAVRAFRNLRLNGRLSLEKDRAANIKTRTPVFLLLKRAINDFERLVTRLAQIDLSDRSQRHTLNREIGDLALSILAAETLDLGES